LKFGIFVDEPKKIEGFDFDVYRLKPETGRLGTPQTDMYSNIACFGDNVTAREHPDRISVSKLWPSQKGMHTCIRTGRTGIDGIIYLSSTVAHMREFQKAAVDRIELRDELKTYGC